MPEVRDELLERGPSAAGTVARARETVEISKFLEACLPGRAMGKVRDALQVFCSSPLLTNLLVTGNPGTGKSHLAGIVAAALRWETLPPPERGAISGRPISIEVLSEKSVGRIELPGIQDTLIESELFGYRRGAFTGAHQDKVGLLSTSYEVILLDEIGDASPSMQAKLLRLAQDHRFRPIGASMDTEFTYEGKLVFATNKDLNRLVREGRFREDLLHRLSLIHVQLPDLREDPDYLRFSIEVMLMKIGREACNGNGNGNGRANGNGKNHGNGGNGAEIVLSPEDEAWAMKYSWPGNFRELEGAFRRWIALGHAPGGLRKSAEASMLTLPGPIAEGASFGDFRKALFGRVDEFLYDEIRRIDEQTFHRIFPESSRPSALRVVRRGLSRSRAEEE
ncbi:MAG: sigma 54-interacting transcriptional regulator [Nitrospirae bacterium]|nr:sigma 54-interacting transcriptional regulator [Nitrospirota bacterium]